MDEPVSDAAIITLSLADPERFALIFERHYEPIFRYLVRRLGRDTGARLASEVFTRAFESRRRFRPAAVSARPWLFGIAANLVRMEARSHRRSLSAHLRTPTDLPIDGRLLFQRVDERIDAAALSRDPQQGLAELRPAQRETLLLFALGELTYREVAESMGVPIGTVRSRLARARTTLRELMGEVGQSYQWNDGT